MKALLEIPVKVPVEIPDVILRLQKMAPVNY
jgi:hypothetical protein